MVFYNLFSVRKDNNSQSWYQVCHTIMRNWVWPPECMRKIRTWWYMFGIPALTRQQIPRACWSVSLVYLVGAGLKRHLASMKVDNTWGTHLMLTFGLPYMCTYTCICIFTYMYLHTQNSTSVTVYAEHRHVRKSQISVLPANNPIRSANKSEENFPHVSKY